VNWKGVRQRPSLGTLLTAGLVASFVYLVVAWFVLLPGVFCTPDEGAKWLQSQALRWEDGELAHDIAYTGYSLDPEMRFAVPEYTHGFLEVREGELYFRRLPLFPATVIPLVRWFGVYGLYVLPAVSGVACGVLTLLLLEPQDRRWRMWGLIAFGSPVFLYATLFWEHTLATGIALGGTALALQIGTKHFRFHHILYWLVVGIVFGFSLYLRLEIVLFAMAFLVSCGITIREHRWGVLLAIFCVVVALLFYPIVHSVVLGDTRPGNTDYLFYPFAYLRRAQWRAIVDLLIGPPIKGSLSPGWLGGLWAIAAILTMAHSFVRKESITTRRLRAVGLGVNVALAAHFLFTSEVYYAAHGLLPTTPWVLLGIARSRQIWREGEMRGRIITLTVIIGLLAYSVAILGFRGSEPDGGLEWGARFAFTFYPLLALMSAWRLPNTQRFLALRVFLAALLILGLGFQVRGVWTMRQNQDHNVSLTRQLTQLSESHLVTDLGWLPLNTAPIYGQKATFIVDNMNELTAWLELAQGHHVTRFILATAEHDPLLKSGTLTLERKTLEVVEVNRISGVILYQISVGMP
jgi:multisubunit Na+/H+ antiporter MnhB subunit